MTSPMRHQPGTHVSNISQPEAKPALDHFRLIVEKLQSPTVLLDASGQLNTLNVAALSLWKRFQLDGEWLLQEAEQIKLYQHDVLGVFLPNILSLGVPTLLAGSGNVLIRVVPLQEDPGIPLGQGKINGYWVEWLNSLDVEASIPQASVLSEQLAIYQDVAQAVNSSLILEDIFESLADVLANYLLFDEGVIVILDDTQNGIKLLVRFYPDGTLDISGENNAFAGYDPVIDHTLREQESQIYSLEMPESIVVHADAQSALVVPLVNKGIVIGLITLSAIEENTYNTVAQQLLNQVSTQLAVAVENAKLYWQTQAQASREFLINQLTMAIRQSLDIDMILSTAVMELGKVLGVSRCFIRYYESALVGEDSADEERDRLFAYHLPGVSMMRHWEKPNQEDASNKTQDFERQVFSFRKEQSYNPFILNDIRDCPPQLADETFFAENGIKSIAVIPILIRNTVVGTITLHQCETYRSWVMEDIELIKAMAEHLGVALQQATLFQTLDQKNHQLEETLQELQQAQLYLIQSEKMAVLGQFVAGIAHEVNTPLGTMISNTNTLKTCLQKIEGLELPQTPDLAKLMGSMGGLLDLNKMAGERIQEIVKNLRNFARLDESEMKTVDIHEGIESTILVMSSSIPRGVSIVRNYGKDIPAISCYPGLLNQVFMNLLVNATHALDEKLQKEKLQEPGSDAASITINSEYDEQAKRIYVRFTDNGKGISPENLTRIFDPGFTTKGAGVGTGLGLALCYRIVEKHHGRISVESTLGQGTSFTVSLPAQTKV